MSNPILAQRLIDAVDAWLDPPQTDLFWKNWRGSGDGTDPTVPCLALVQYCKAVECSPDEVLAAQLQRLTACNENHHLEAAKYYPPAEERTYQSEEKELLKQNRSQLPNLVQGIVATVQAAIAETAGDRKLACSHLACAARHYDTAWKLTSRKMPVPKATADDPYSSRGSVQLLQQALSPEWSPDGITISTWLILQQLLMTLFREPLPEPDFTNQAKLLFFEKGSGKIAFKGSLKAFQVERIACDQPGLLLDPLAFGVTVLDADMQHSLRAAFRCCRQRAEAKPGGLSTTFLLRLTGELPPLTSMLEGDSAGGLLAVGLLTTAEKQWLDRRRTATVSLNLKSGISEDDNESLTAAEIELGTVGKIAEKLKAAGKLTAGIELVALYADDHTAWEELNKSCPVPPQSIGVSNLESLLEVLRGETIHEEVLARHCDEVAEEWGRIASTPDSAENDEHRFDRYVWPTYHLERPTRQISSDQPFEMRGYDEEPVPGEDDEALIELLKRLGPERGLVVYDKAGAGKTVFSLRLRHVATLPETRQRLFGHRPPLVIRLHGAWPEKRTVRSMVEQDPLLRKLVRNEEQRRQAVDYALKERRVLFILDGFDQFTRAERDHVASLFRIDHAKADPDAGQCRWVITSRVHTIEEQRRQLFDDKRWTRARINPLSKELQDRYFADYGLDGEETPLWRQMVPAQDGTDDLLALPLVLRMLRRVLDDHFRQGHRPEKPLPKFLTLGAMFLHVASGLLLRAITTSQTDGSLQQAGLTVDTADPKVLALLEHVLCLLAFQMLLDENYNGVLYGQGEERENPVEQFLERARQRYFLEVDAEAELPLKASQKIRLQQRIETMMTDWTWAISVLKAIELNHRASLESLQDEAIAFRNRKMVECYAARYLTKYATEWDIRDETGAPCARDFTNNPQWRDCWLLAIEMPRHLQPHVKKEEILNEAVTRRSLSVLFERPKQEIRPNELIYRAWHLFEIDDQLLRERQFLVEGQLRLGAELEPAERTRKGQELILPGAEAVLEEFRKSSRDLVKAMQKNTAAQQHASTKNHAAWLKKWQHADCQTKSKTFVQCPPQAWIEEFEAGKRNQDPCVNVMGSPEGEGGYDNEKPQHQVRVRRFQMLATPVTRGLYHHYDPAFQKSQRAAKSLQNYASPPAKALGEAAVPDNYPIIETDWFDSWVFCRWLGPEYALATECQWEHACRAGTTTKYYMGDEVDHSQANFDAVEGHTTIAGDARYPANQYGLFDVHGNVREWCQDWYDGDWYSDRLNKAADDVSSEDEGPTVGSSRVLRGGAWNGPAEFCRSAFRDHRDPDNRYNNVGFRVVSRLSLCECSQSSSD